MNMLNPNVDNRQRKAQLHMLLQSSKPEVVEQARQALAALEAEEAQYAQKQEEAKPHRTVGNFLRSAANYLTLSTAPYMESTAKRAIRGDEFQWPWHEDVRKEAGEIQKGVEKSGFEEDLFGPALAAGAFASPFTVIPKAAAAINASKGLGAATTGAELGTDVLARTAMDEESQEALKQGGIWGAGGALLGGLLGSAGRKRASTQAIVKGEGSLNDYITAYDKSGSNTIVKNLPQEMSMRRWDPDLQAAAKSGDGTYMDVYGANQDALAEAMGDMPGLNAPSEIMQTLERRVDETSVRIASDLKDIMKTGIVSPRAMQRQITDRVANVKNMQEVLTKSPDNPDQLRYIKPDPEHGFGVLQYQNLENLKDDFPDIKERIVSTHTNIHTAPDSPQAIYGPGNAPSMLSALEVERGLTDVINKKATEHFDPEVLVGKRQQVRDLIIRSDPSAQTYFDHLDGLEMLENSRSMGDNVFSDQLTVEDMRAQIAELKSGERFQEIMARNFETNVFPSDELAEGAGSSGNFLVDVFKSRAREKLMDGLNVSRGEIPDNLKGMFNSGAGIAKLAELSDDPKTARLVLESALGREELFNATMQNLKDNSKRKTSSYIGKDKAENAMQYVGNVLYWAWGAHKGRSPVQIFNKILTSVGVIPRVRGAQRSTLDFALRPLPEDITDIDAVIADIKKNREEFLSGVSSTGIRGMPGDDDGSLPGQSTGVGGPSSPLDPQGGSVSPASTSQEFNKRIVGESRNPYAGGFNGNPEATGPWSVDRQYAAMMDDQEVPPWAYDDFYENPQQMAASPEPTLPDVEAAPTETAVDRVLRETEVTNPIDEIAPAVDTPGGLSEPIINPTARATRISQDPAHVSTYQNMELPDGRKLTANTLKTPVEELKGEPLLDRIRTANARGEMAGPLYGRLADHKLELALDPTHKSRYKITGKWTDLEGKSHIRKAPTGEQYVELSEQIDTAVKEGNLAKAKELRGKWAEWQHAQENLDIYIPLRNLKKKLDGVTPGSEEYNQIRGEMKKLHSAHLERKRYNTKAVDGGGSSNPWAYDRAPDDVLDQAMQGSLFKSDEIPAPLPVAGPEPPSVSKEDAAAALTARTQGDAATEAGEQFRSDAASGAAQLHRQVMNDRFGRLSKTQVEEKTKQLDDLTDQYDTAVKAGDSEMAESLQREMRIIKQDLNPAGVTEADPEAVAKRAEATETRASKSPADTTGVRRGVAASLYRTVDEANRMQGASIDELDRVLNAGDGGQVRNVSPSDSDVSPTSAGDLGRAQEGYGSSMTEKLDALSRSDWDIEDSAIPEKFRNSMDLMGGLDTKTKKRYAHLLNEGGDDLQKENIEDIYRAIDDPSKISDLTPEEVDALSYAVQNLDEFSSSSVQGIVPKLTDAQKAGATSARRMDDMYAQISGRKRVGVDPDDRTVPSVTMLTGERVSAEDVYDNFLNDLVEKNKLDTFVKDQELGMNMIVDHMDSAAPMPGSDFILSRINRAETTGQYANERFFGYGDLSQHDEAIGEFQAYGFGTLSQNPAGLEDLVAHITNPKKGMLARLRQAREAGHADNISKYERMINEAETQVKTIVGGLTTAQKNSKKAKDALEVYENSLASSWYETPRSGHGIVGGVHTKATPRPKKPAGPKPPPKPREEPQESDMPYDDWEFEY